MHAARVNALAKKFGAKRYLEIGVCEGTTFLNVEVAYKVAVDPNFLFDFQSKSSKRQVFHPVPSDTFFAETKEDPFDLIFLDGLHTFEQTLRDFLSSRRFAHDKTIWLIDDTMPSDGFAALPSAERCYRLRQSRGIVDWAWMGDVFKVVFFLRSAMPFYDFRTFRHSGQTVVWGTPFRYNARPALPLASIGSMTFEDFVEHFDMLNPIEDDTVLEAVGR